VLEVVRNNGITKPKYKTEKDPLVNLIYEKLGGKRTRHGIKGQIVRLRSDIEQGLEKAMPELLSNLPKKVYIPTVWTEDEKQRLFAGVGKFGRKWFKVAEFVKTRSPKACAHWISKVTTAEFETYDSASQKILTSV
jgi:hypothetical protein